MILPFDLKQYYRIAIGLGLILGLVTLPIDVLWAKSKPNKTETRSAKQKAKAKPARPNAAARKAKAKVAAPAQIDPVTELEIISGEATTLRNALGADPDDAPSRQKLAVLALRAARAAERALSRGDDDLFNAYREQVRTRFADTRPGLEAMSGRGIGAAEYALGAFALHGMLEPASVERACAHFAAAVDKGFGGAKFRHAQCIEESDPARALVLLTEAADGGHVGANERLGRICLEAEPPDAPCAFARLDRAAKEGRASAKTLLGWMHAEGIGSKVDAARAARYYREAAQQGEPSARNNLGELYEKGRSVAKDEKAAFEYYLAAAQSGFPPAQFNAGRLYAAGRGTPRNLDEARRWLGEAEKAGITPAREILDMLDKEAAK
ncbi:MAG: tetratricopeptide repeat protein [Betaproteobacteria bacterium]|nr:tetratricopeptide repeat protein [Betaproteobacteria bacterium]